MKQGMDVQHRPGLGLFLSEPSRAMGEYGAMLAASPVLLAAPRGDGHTVLVLPGFLAEDVSTLTLRTYLRSRGYDVHGWHLGRNLGPTVDIRRGMSTLLRELSDRGGAPVSIVGWSLGGIFARELARSHPGLARQVITLGSPFRLADPRDSRANATFQRYSDLHEDASLLPSREDLANPIPVPSTAIYSRLDGIVPWQACTEVPGPRRESVAVYSSHLGFGHNPAALWVIADRLAQRAGEWRPFRAPAVARRLFPTKDAVAA
jgi:pimeloyl-ACP methyl ester carboxylesterase